MMIKVCIELSTIEAFRFRATEHFLCVDRHEKEMIRNVFKLHVHGGSHMKMEAFHYYSQKISEVFLLSMLQLSIDRRPSPTLVCDFNQSDCDQSFTQSSVPYYCHRAVLFRSYTTQRILRILPEIYVHSPLVL